MIILKKKNKNFFNINLKYIKGAHYIYFLYISLDITLLIYKIKIYKIRKGQNFIFSFDIILSIRFLEKTENERKERRKKVKYSNKCFLLIPGERSSES